MAFSEDQLSAQFVITQQALNVVQGLSPGQGAQILEGLERLSTSKYLSSEMDQGEIDGKTYRVGRIGDFRVFFRALTPEEKGQQDRDNDRDVFVIFAIDTNDPPRMPKQKRKHYKGPKNQ